VIVLTIITILAVFVALQPIIPTSAERFSEVGILGPQQTFANYTKTIRENQTFPLYGFVENNQGVAEYYKLLVKLGNSSTVVSNSTSANAPALSGYSIVLNDGQNSTFPMNLSINRTGTNLRLIFELWMFNVTTSSFAYTGLWDQLWINVTST